MVPWQGLISPVIAPGWAGTALVVTANVLAVPGPHVFDGVTPMSPDADPAVTVIKFDPWPAVMLQPDGTVQA